MGCRTTPWYSLLLGRLAEFAVALVVDKICGHLVEHVRELHHGLGLLHRDGRGQFAQLSLSLLEPLVRHGHERDVGRPIEGLAVLIHELDVLKKMLLRSVMALVAALTDDAEIDRDLYLFLVARIALRVDRSAEEQATFRLSTAT